MPRQFTRSRGRSGSRRLTSWIGIDPIINVEAGNSVSLTHALNAAALAKRPFTIVRTYLELNLSSDQLSASESQIGAVAIAVVSDQASAIGVTAVPTPITDLASDLFLLHQLLFNEWLVNSAVGFDSVGGRRYSIDSKAMRKVNDDQDIVVTVEAASTSNGFNLTMGGRMLIKES